MATNDSFEAIYPPGSTGPNHEYGQEFGDQFHAPRVQELLASTHAFTQRGVQLAAGQGILPTGCILAQKTADGLYYAYNSGAGDGTGVPLGVLRDSRDTGGAGSSHSPQGQMGNMVIRGILRLDLVSGTDSTSLITGAGGGLGSGTGGASTKLQARIDPVNNYFIF